MPMPATKRKTTRKAPAKRTTTNTTAAKTTSTTKKTEWWFLENFNREDNLHMFLGIILLVIGLYQLRTRLLGLLFIIVGILFVTGYFEKGKRK